MGHISVLLHWLGTIRLRRVHRTYQAALGGHLVGDADHEGPLQRRYRVHAARDTAEARDICGRNQAFHAEGLKVVHQDGSIPLTGLDHYARCLEKILAATAQSLVLQVVESSPLIAALGAAGYTGTPFDGVDDSVQLLSNPSTAKALEAAYSSRPSRPSLENAGSRR